MNTDSPFLRTSLEQLLRFALYYLKDEHLYANEYSGRKRHETAQDAMDRRSMAMELNQNLHDLCTQITETIADDERSANATNCDADGEPYTPARLAAWLSAKFLRHGEEDDIAAADMLTKQEAEIERLRTLLQELHDCGAVENWLRVSDDLKVRVEAALGPNVRAERGA